MREIESAGEKDRVGDRSGHSHSKRQKCNMIIRMFAVKRWTFPSDKLFITVFFNKGHFRSDYKSQIYDILTSLDQLLLILQTFFTVLQNKLP